jgi:hypothetical protein
VRKKEFPDRSTSHDEHDNLLGTDVGKWPLDMPAGH